MSTFKVFERGKVVKQKKINDCHFPKAIFSKDFFRGHRRYYLIQLNTRIIGIRAENWKLIVGFAAIANWNSAANFVEYAVFPYEKLAMIAGYLQ